MTATTAAVLAVLREGGVLCHCLGDGTGHHVGATACVAPRIVPVPIGRPKIESWGANSRDGRGPAMPPGAGTCTTCARPGVRLDTVTLRTAPDGHDAMPGVRLGKAVELRPHRNPGRGGKPCPGRVARETRYRLSEEVETFVRAFGPASVVRR